MEAQLVWEKTNESTMLVVSNEGSVSDEAWDALCEEVERSGVSTYFAVIVGTTSVNPTQRRRLGEILKARGIKSCVVMFGASSLMRGLVTAVSWFVPNIRTFNSLDDAAGTLALSPEGRRDLVRSATRLKDALSLAQPIQARR